MWALIALLIGLMALALYLGYRTQSCHHADDDTVRAFTAERGWHVYCLRCGWRSRGWK